MWQRTLIKEFGVIFCLPKKIDGWLLETLDGRVVSDRGRVLLALCSVFFYLGPLEERNRVFEDKSSPLLESFWLFVQRNAYNTMPLSGVQIILFFISFFL